MEKIKEHWENHAGTYGWAGLAAYIIAYDVLAPETLTHAAERGLDHSKAMRVAVWAGAGIVAGHVLRVYPREYDPLQRTADYIGGLISGSAKNS